MPTYNAVIAEGQLSPEAKSRVAVTLEHASAMGAPICSGSGPRWRTCWRSPRWFGSIASTIRYSEPPTNALSITRASQHSEGGSTARTRFIKLLLFLGLIALTRG
jgi:hypothetical protein